MLDSKRGGLESEATAQPTEPQPLPKPQKLILLKFQHKNTFSIIFTEIFHSDHPFANANGKCDQI